MKVDTYSIFAILLRICKLYSCFLAGRIALALLFAKQQRKYLPVSQCNRQKNLSGNEGRESRSVILALRQFTLKHFTLYLMSFLIARVLVDQKRSVLVDFCQSIVYQL